MKTTFKSATAISPIVSSTLIKLPTPSNISYMYNMGSMLGFTLVLQIATGIFLSMHYTANAELAFESIMHIARDVNNGWMMKNLHSNGASLFFILIYLHISRGLLNSSYKKKETWITGTIMLFILMGTAFLGYVLPWGQMSFWGATVITNLASAIPLVGTTLVEWLWGGFSVSNATLNRFLSLHFVMPFMLAGMAMIHIASLHTKGSSNPLGLSSDKEKLPFAPFFSWSDLLAPSLVLTLLMMLISLSPQILGDPENFNPANPMSTPIHIQPEWYFLFAYAILRSIPNKLGGVLALVMSILVILLLTSKKSMKSSSKFNPNKKTLFWMTAAIFTALTWIGMKPVEDPYITLGKLYGTFYFVTILSIYPLQSLFWKQD